MRVSVSGIALESVSGLPKRNPRSTSRVKVKERMLCGIPVGNRRLLIGGMMNKISIDLFTVLFTVAMIVFLAIVGFAGFMLILLSRTPV
jgi:hypothetical protein